jgi:hypothetical protein
MKCVQFYLSLKGRRLRNDGVHTAQITGGNNCCSNEPDKHLEAVIKTLNS